MPKVVDADSRRAEVADALFRLAVREGLHRVSLRTVAVEAGLNVGSVRHYFDNQADLMRFAMRSVIDRVSARLTAKVESLGDVGALSAAERRAKRVELLAELLPLDDVRRAEVTVFLEFAGAARTDPGLADLARESALGTRALVRRALTALDLPDLDAEVVRLTALLDGLSLGGVLHPDLWPADATLAVLRNHLEALDQS
ncbi:TetR/AcrR family transcriptional regulator [Amycolatopsis thermophila]|uniref:AcrR family transcriptional regulator n=1 Tax=Amycolatopsis thermophila TaxID=206084 RepID=A0ABU0ER23_9PSEU|nr:TetR family transcriptional regulator C-terminal domain-containing protein [Amycolatopsis thermophila]MDQ0377750.1 AcrR family transcriptional regulator [Amycolatopsis thermophila]